MIAKVTPPKIKPTHMWKVDMVNPSKNQKRDGRISLGGLQSLHGFSSSISLAPPLPPQNTHTQNNKKDKVYKLLIGRSNLFES
jgi:hypothetical protein